jgi:hypothetical protein
MPHSPEAGLPVAPWERSATGDGSTRIVIAAIVTIAAVFLMLVVGGVLLHAMQRPAEPTAKYTGGGTREPPPRYDPVPVPTPVVEPPPRPLPPVVPRSTPPAPQGGSLDFTLKNRLGVVITHIFVSPHHVDTWEEDVLGTSRVLIDGDEIRIHFFPRAEARGDLWDLKIRTAHNQEYFWNDPGFNLRRISEITIILQGGRASAISR